MALTTFRTTASAAFAVAALLLSAVPAGAADHRRGSIRVDGVERTYGLTVPARPPSGRYAGIVVVLHGGGTRETGERIRQAVGFDAAAERHGWIALYPDARGGRFHAGACCGTRPSRTDDVRLVKRLVKRVRRHHRVRADRVFATGFSNGGFLAYRLACRTRLLTAVAGVATTELIRRCRPPRPVSVLHVHARDDDTVRFEGRAAFKEWTLGAFALAERWRRRNRCPEGTTTREETGALLVTETAGCRRGTRVRLAVPTTGGHAWPGALPDYGPGSDALDATAEIATFFANARQRVGGAGTPRYAG
jgi:polyhydroxybutyrate depolymerase